MLEPDEQVQVVAPVGVSVKDPPKQINPEFTPKVGVGETVTVDTTPVLFTQPDEFVPITV